MEKFFFQTEKSILNNFLRNVKKKREPFEFALNEFQKSYFFAFCIGFGPSL